MTRILVIDNYDSFVFTLVGYIQQLGAETTVIRNDEYELDAVIKLAEEHDGVLVSPGPGARRSRRHHRHHRWAAEAKKPLLGVCLGHQAIAEAFGGTVTHALNSACTARPPASCTRTSPSSRRAPPLHRDPLPLPAVVPKPCPRSETTSTTDNGIIMGLRHRSPHARRAVPPPNRS